ncbi:MAG: hypothetical protein IPL77_11320 [Flavobacteriales bacterium]|nr:hypothetical protein [Flavobacteriales bacterium]
MSADGEAQEAMINLARDLGIGIVGSPDDIRKAIAQKISADRDACETERDRLRSELDAAHDGEDALRSEVTRLRAQIAALQPEGRRVGPDEVVVGREEWEAVQEFADLIVPIRDNLSGISWIGKLSDVFAAYDRWYAVRTSAQAHNGEGVNHG